MNAERVLQLLQASSCFRRDVCTMLPCACAETIADIIKKQTTRIEALEAALRKIAEWPPLSRVDDIINAFIDAKLFARATLYKDTGK